MDPKNQLMPQIFQLLFDSMLSAGGDGDSALCCDNWYDISDVFDQWLIDNHPNFLIRIDNDDSVVFSGNQESIMFTNKYKSLPDWYDCVIKI
jgi:hypothetical protein